MFSRETSFLLILGEPRYTMGYARDTRIGSEEEGEEQRDKHVSRISSKM